VPLGKPLLAALDRMGHGGLVLDTAGQVIRPIRSIAPAILLGAGLTAASAPALSANDQFEPRIREAGQTLAMSNAAVAALDPQQRDQLIEFIIGNTLFTLTHELGHAVISEFQLPVIGREEDAADAFATLALLHVGSDFAHRVLEDAARGLLTLAARDVKMGHEPVFYDEHGLDQQRAYQITCFMVGSDPRGFRTLAEQMKLPPERQESCRGDHDQAQASWLQLLEPHLRSAPPKPSFLDRLLKRPAPVSGPPEARIAVSYGAASGDLAPYRDVLKTVGLLEIVRDFVVRNFALPRRITFEAKTCGEPNAWWDAGGRRLTVCYEIVQDYVSLGLAK
jgi:hypothetical protein